MRVVINFPRVVFRDEGSYSAIFNSILEIERPLPLIQFQTTTTGIDVVMELSEEKMVELKELLKDHNFIVKSHVMIEWDRELCVDCGACVSLCNTGALFYREPGGCVCYDSAKCVQCGLCVDACPRRAITKT